MSIIDSKLAHACTGDTCGSYKQFLSYYQTFFSINPIRYMRLYEFNYNNAVVISNAYTNAIKLSRGTTYAGAEARRQYLKLFGRTTSEGIWRNMFRHTGVLIDANGTLAWVMPVCLCVAHIKYIGYRKDIEIEVEWEMPHPFLVDVNEYTCEKFMIAYLIDIILDAFGNPSIIQAIDQGYAEFKIEPLEKLYLQPVGDDTISLISKGGSIDVYTKVAGKRTMLLPAYEYPVKSLLIDVPAYHYIDILTSAMARTDYIPPGA